MTYLGPGRGVPFEARPLETRGFILWLLAASTRLLIKHLELSSADAGAEDDPPLHSAAAGRVALQTETQSLPAPETRSADLLLEINQVKVRRADAGLTRSQSWLSQCGAQSLSPQGWMARGLFSGEHWCSGTTRPSGVLQ